MEFYIVWIACGVVALILAYKMIMANVMASRPEGMITRDELFGVRVLLVLFSLLLGPIALGVAAYGRYIQHKKGDE